MTNNEYKTCQDCSHFGLPELICTNANSENFNEWYGDIDANSCKDFEDRKDYKGVNIATVFERRYIEAKEQIRKLRVANENLQSKLADETQKCVLLTELNKKQKKRLERYEKAT